MLENMSVYMTIGLGVLAALWFFDEIITKMDIKRFGLKNEANPIIQKLFRQGEGAVITYKIVSFIGVAAISGVLFYFDQMFALYFIVIIAGIYFIVDMHNIEVYAEK